MTSARTPRTAENGFVALEVDETETFIFDETARGSA
jgi:hypothetical protein